MCMAFVIQMGKLGSPNSQTLLALPKIPTLNISAADTIDQMLIMICSFKAGISANVCLSDAIYWQWIPSEDASES